MSEAGARNIPEVSSVPEPSGARDFDFLIGEWLVHNRRLKERLKGSNSWIEFEATLDVRKVLDGCGNIDHYKTIRDGRYFEGMSIRIFNPSMKQWSIYWVDSWNCVLETPVAGGFKNGVGEFLAEDTFEGKKILMRFLWSDIMPNSARWEQAFSEDCGRTWETNWIMEFVRRATPAP
ncbi:MAG: DUF1579 domain-containing protein [Blastocatellia bacterium]|nr:DUF1579 domain-containing protein [Blastocatellia bacterium]